MDKVPMDEMQNLGVLGLLQEVRRVIRSYWRLIVPLHVTLLLPVCCMSLAYLSFLQSLSDSLNVDYRSYGSYGYRYSSLQWSYRYMMQPWRGTAAPEKLPFWTIAGDFVLDFLSLISFTAILYSVTCIYIGKGAPHWKVHRFWKMKRLMVTALWAYCTMKPLSVTMDYVLRRFPDPPSYAQLVPLMQMAANIALFLYGAMIWATAIVVSVLEDTFGLDALKRSMQLLEGKNAMGCVPVIFYGITNFVGTRLFLVSVVHSTAGAWWWKLSFASIVISLFWTLAFVGQSVLYFVREAYHDERIDKLALSDHLDRDFGN